jgi:hypothetical protein
MAKLTHEQAAAVRERLWRTAGYLCRLRANGRKWVLTSRQFVRNSGVHLNSHSRPTRNPVMYDKSDPKDGVGTEAPSPPPLRLSPICPNCGRANAVVFPIIVLGESRRLVCLKCYPDLPSDS